jgi:hypothetical protein
MPTIKQQCRSCDGTGLYSGFAEPKGTAVICLDCDGKGWNNYSYKEFAGRKHKPGIKTVSLSRGRFIVTGVGPSEFKEDIMTYAQFEAEFPRGK